MIQADKIEKLIRQKLEGTDKFLVSLHVKQSNRIFVFIDGDHDITIDDCTNMSRFIESYIDRDVEDYELVVSSSGADQPITMPRQYIKNVGRSITFKLADGRQFSGKLLGTDEQGITVQPEISNKKKTELAESEHILFISIKEAKVKLVFHK